MNFDQQEVIKTMLELQNHVGCDRVVTDSNNCSTVIDAVQVGL
jgi:hypothetical protein